MATRYIKANESGLYSHEECFNREFGIHGNDKIYFGKAGKHNLDTNPSRAVIEIVGPLHVMDSGVFDSLDGMNMGGDRVLILSENPDAQIGDEDNIQERDYRQESPSRNIDTYTSETDEDPAPPRDSMNKPSPRPVEWWIPPAHVRYVIIERTDIRDTNTAIFIASKTTVTEDIPLEAQDGIAMEVDGVMGTWYAD